MEKLSKTARWLDVVFIILFWAIIASALAMAISTALNIASLSSGKVIPPEALPALNIDFADAWITSDAISMNDFITVRICSAVSLALTSAVLCYAIHVIRHILKPMKSGRPFEGSVSADLKKLGWVSLIYGILYVAYDIFGKQLVLRALTPYGSATTVTVGHNINPTFIVAGFVLFLFSYIFRYGEELQQLSDETL